MGVSQIDAGALAADLPVFDLLVDARSPAEYAEDHLPGAVNWPVLDDEQRRVVGTLYKQVGALEARKLGAVLASRNIASHLETQLADKPRDWRPLVYCWRGGQRSGSLALVLGQIGFRTGQLAGGYKAFRAVVREQLASLPAAFAWQVLCGRTGSAKTRLLQALAAEGAQTLDLEGLARHRGSVLGGLPGDPQPAQKAFETALWSALRGLDPARPVFIESESVRIGRLQVPEALIDAIRRDGRCLRVEMALPARVDFLMQDYGYFVRDPEGFCDQLDALVPLRGRETVTGWQDAARRGDWPACLGGLLAGHYDPLYDRSIRKHYAGYDQAVGVELPDASPASLQQAARNLCKAAPPALPAAAEAAPDLP